MRKDAAKVMEDEEKALSESAKSNDLQIILRELLPPSNNLQDMERRIILCQKALRLVPQQENETLWAALKREMAYSLSRNPLGNRAENIEDAIYAYQQSLQVTTQEVMPVEWSFAMNVLANAYSDRIRGNKAENIELAIDAYKQSLQVRTRDNMPIEWAQSMNNLAIAYSDRVRGDRANNTELAVNAYKQSLKVMTQEVMPVEWAQSMGNLAIAYSRRIRGDRAENIELAIDAYKQSLQVRTRENMPIDWAQSMGNLATAYYSRIQGDRAENIELAINAHKQSLQVRTRENMPIDWAVSTMNLAIAYTNRIRGDKAKNIESAIDLYQQMLQVMTRENMPVDWAMSMHNLAIAYSERIRGDKAKNIEDAIMAYRRSLEVRTQEAMPVEWAQSMHNLALAYSDRIRGDHAENIEMAITAYTRSLETFTPDSHPNDCRRTALLSANLHADENQWNKALILYEQALCSARILYRAARSKVSQEAELTETDDLHRRAAYAYAKVGNLTMAFSTLERGRVQNSRHDLAKLEAIHQTKPELINRYQTAANAINQLESTERYLTTNSQFPQYSKEDFRQQATQARQSLKNCLTEIRQIPGYENLLSLPTFEEVAATVQPSHPLVYLVSTPNGSLALILTTAGTRDLWLNDLTEPQLIDLLNNDWFRAYEERQTNPQTWLEAIDEVTHQLWNSMMAPLINHLQKNNLSKAILMPTGYLSYLPLHAAWTLDDTKINGRRYACDDIHFTYAPNALSLNAARNVADRTSDNTLLVIKEPFSVDAGDLPGAGFESQKAISVFGKGNWKLLQEEKATRTAVLEQLPDKDIVHFACHGFADLATPLNSGLLMAHNEILSLRDLLDLKLQNLRLAILSACETGIPGTKLPDEVISLPTGLLQAGAAGVVSSLWSVADLSTMVLLSRFYDLWRTHKLDPPEALRQAQIWLRDSDGSALSPYLKSAHPDVARQLEQVTDQCPFAHPFHWAAFTYVGV